MCCGLKFEERFGLDLFLDVRCASIAFQRVATEDRGYVRENEGGDVPEIEFGGKAFALAGGFVDDPVALSPEIGGGGAGQGGEEGVGGFGGVIEHDGAAAFGGRRQAF